MSNKGMLIGFAIFCLMMIIASVVAISCLDVRPTTSQ